MLEDKKDCDDQAQGMDTHSYWFAPFYMQPAPSAPLASIFSCLFIPIPPRPIPFPTFFSPPKHPVVSLVPKCSFPGPHSVFHVPRQYTVCGVLCNPSYQLIMMGATSRAQGSSGFPATDLEGAGTGPLFLLLGNLCSPACGCLSAPSSLCSWAFHGLTALPCWFLDLPNQGIIWVPPHCSSVLLCVNGGELFPT